MATCLVCKRGSISTRDVLLRASDEDDTRVSVCNRCPQSQIYDRLKEAATNGGIRLRSPRRNSNIRTHWVSIDTVTFGMSLRYKTYAEVCHTLFNEAMDTLHSHSLGQCVSKPG